MALGFVIVRCLLVYRLAEVRGRHRLRAAEKAVPNQFRRPTAWPTMSCLFQCFEGVDLHHWTVPDGDHPTQVLRLNALHRQVLRLLGAAYEQSYLIADESAT